MMLDKLVDLDIVTAEVPKGKKGGDVEQVDAPPADQETQL